MTRCQKCPAQALIKCSQHNMVADHQKDIAEYKEGSKAKDAAGHVFGSNRDLTIHLDAAKSVESLPLI